MTLSEQLPTVRLDGHVALVTGAGRGIGRAIALALSDAGAAVAVCARSKDEVRGVCGEIEGRGGAHWPSGAMSPIASRWQVLEVNLRGPLYCTRAVLSGMLAWGRGRIVNVCSGVGLTAIPMLSAYEVSKTALYRLSENLAAETGGHGVMVFAIDPGLVRTATSQAALSCGEPSIEQWFTDAFASKDDVPAESAAALIVYLASGAADVLSGRNILATEDVTSMVARATEIKDHDLYVLRERG